MSTNATEDRITVNRPAQTQTVHSRADAMKDTHFAITANVKKVGMFNRTEKTEWFRVLCCGTLGPGFEPTQMLVDT